MIRLAALTFDGALAEVERRGLRPICGGAYVAAIAAVVAALVSAYATYSASQAQAKLLEYQQDVSEEQARVSRDAAAANAENQQDQAAHIRAAQRSRIGASGILGDVGSPLLAAMEQASNLELDRRRIIFEGEMQATSHEQTAILRGYEKTQTIRQGYIAAGASLLSRGAEAGAKYYNSGSGSGGSTGRTESAYQSYRSGERDRSPYRY